MPTYWASAYPAIRPMKSTVAIAVVRMEAPLQRNLARRIPLSRPWALLLRDDTPQRRGDAAQEHYKTLLCASESLRLVSGDRGDCRGVWANASAGQAAAAGRLRQERRIRRLHQPERPSAVQDRHPASRRPLVHVR